MRVLSTAAQISVTFKNVARMRDIASVFIKYGFRDLIHRLRLSSFMSPTSTNEVDTLQLSTPDRLRKSFEELGPTFIKLGQLISSRPDLIPEPYVESFEKLQDKVTPVPWVDIKRLIEAQLGNTVDSLFETVDPIPLAAASIAQVHAAVLKSGEKVVLKIQRPDIDLVVENDISILRGLASLLDRYVPETRPINPVALVEEFFRTTLLELDFRVEANNIRRIRNNLKHLNHVAIPEVYEEYSRDKILCLERFEGIKFSDKEKLIQNHINPKTVVEAGADVFFKMVIEDGLFHADPHGGNLFVLEDGRLALIDFGLVGRLSRKMQDSILIIFTALMEEDFETLAHEYLTICTNSGPTDFSLLLKDLMDTISPYIGMRIGEVNIGKILLRSTTVATRHNLQVPREWMLLFRSMFTLEALGRKLEPTFDLLPLGNKLVKQVLQHRYGKERITRDLMVLARDMQSLVEISPKLLKRFAKKWSGDNFELVLRNQSLDQLNSTLKKTVIALLYCVIASFLVLLGFHLLKNEYDQIFIFNFPISSFIAFLLAFILVWQQIWQFRKLK